MVKHLRYKNYCNIFCINKHKGGKFIWRQRSTQFFFINFITSSVKCGGKSILNLQEVGTFVKSNGGNNIFFSKVELQVNLI